MSLKVQRRSKTKRRVGSQDLARRPLVSIRNDQEGPALQKLHRMCAKYGVEIPPEPVSMSDDGEADVEELADSVPVSLRETYKATFETPMLGQVGTPLSGGRLRDATGRYPPATVRGTGGNYGLYDKYRESETMLYDASASAIELVAGTMPVMRMPSVVPMEHRSAVQDFVDKQNAAIASFRCIDGGFSRFLEECTTFVWAGFWTGEPRFRLLTKGGGYVWSGCEPRIQSTVRKWYTHNDQLLAVGYQANQGGPSDIGNQYTLPAVGPRPIDKHVLLMRIGGYGLDYEGNPPTRPSLHWVAFKRLIAQLVPAVLEKYGVPYTFLKTDPAFISALKDGTIRDLPDLKAAYELYIEMQAQDMPVAYFGQGVVAETTSPQGAAPDLQTWIQYCDQMIAYPFSNEGNLAGMTSSVYGAAEAAERRFMRTAPFYQRKVTDPINEQLIKPLVRWQIGELPEYPSLELVNSRHTDAATWIADARALFGPNLPLDEWPEPFRSLTYKKMGVPVPVTEIEFNPLSTPTQFSPRGTKATSATETTPKPVGTK
jgi:hypothetical protein